MKQLFRSETNKVLAGVIGGLGEYYGMDPVLLRVGLVFLTMLTGIVPGVLAYVVCIFIVPRKPSGAV